MAHFYGSVQGNRGAASRTGSKASGLEALATGWGVGVKVFVSEGPDGDTVRVFRTNGSNGYQSVLIAEFTAGTPWGAEIVGADREEADRGECVNSGELPRLSGLEFEKEAL